MPRNTCRSPSRLPRTRPLVVLTTGDAAAALESEGITAMPTEAAPTPSNSRRRRSMDSGRMGRPVLYQRWPRCDVLAGDGTETKAMAAAVEHMEFAPDARLAQGVVHHQRVLNGNACVVGGVDQHRGRSRRTDIEMRRIALEM